MERTKSGVKLTFLPQRQILAPHAENMKAERRLPSCLVPIDFSIVGATVEASATMEKADDGPFQTVPVRQDRGSHAHLSRSEAAGQQLEALDLQMEAAKATLNG